MEADIDTDRGARQEPSEIIASLDLGADWVRLTYGDPVTKKIARVVDVPKRPIFRAMSGERGTASPA